METSHIHEDVPGGVPLKMWTRGVPVEDAAKRQLTNAARLPIVFKHIAAMPDVHFGIGATVIDAAKTVIRKNFQGHAEAVNCHHNYVQKEHHFGQDVYVTRKGAVSAKAGQLGIIPGSMGARSFIVRGLGHPESFDSCSHGAGRAMSRGEARRRFTLADHRAATEGVECRKDNDVIDETPAAYKDIDAVMAAQRDLVEVVHTLKQVVCVKG